MNWIKLTLASFALLTITTLGYTQTRDSISRPTSDSLNIRKRTVAAVADKFAVTRPLNVEFTNTAPYHYKAENGGNKLGESRMRRFDQTKVSVNVNVIRQKTWMLGATVGYRGTSIEAETAQSGSTDQLEINKDYHYLFSAASFTYFSTLLKKRTFYSATILGEGSDKHFERVKGLFTGTMLLKANAQTKMTVGILVNIDPTAQSPFIPIFTYEHKFNNGLIADITLPKSIYMRKFVFKNNGRVSLGTELDQTTFYVYNLDGTDQRYQYRQLNINSGVVYEHVIGKYFLLTGKSGITLTPNGRLFKKEDSFGDPIYEIKPDPTFYFNVGVSFNPFTVFGRKN
jgi:hypothetical protein